MPHKAIITLLVLYLIPLTGMGVDIYTPSLPAIVRYFAIDPASVKITLAIYLLGYGLGQPFFGTASDTFGRKKPLVIGLILYLIATLLCTLSPNITSLIFFRFLQGLAVSAPGSITKSILSDSFSGKELTVKITYLTMAWGLGPIVAPAIGGYLEYYIGWKANFYFLAAYGLLGLILLSLFFKETNKNLIPWHLKDTLKVYGEIFKHKLFIGSVICLAALYSLIILFNIVGPFVVQVVLKQDAISYGHIAFIMGFAYFLGGIANRLLLRKKDLHQVLPFGLAISLLSCIAMIGIAFTLPVSTLALTIPAFFVIFGGGILFPNFMGKALSLFPGRGGTTSAIMGSLFIIGTSIMAAFGSFLKTQTLEPLAISFFVLILIVLCTQLTLFRKKIS